ncbi:MAG: redox-sensitive bicupin YhaK (pirin superfamily), partial [Myxococcota bacterium]
WNQQIPRHTVTDSQGIGTEVVTVVGAIDGIEGPPPPPNSWASRPESGMAIWTIRIPPGGHYTLPAGPAGTHRVAYLFKGASLKVADRDVSPEVAIQLRPNEAIALVNGDTEAELLLLQARPIGEPVARHGPFVMNTEEEIRQAFTDYHAGHFGRWPWPDTGPVHPRDKERFALHADGRLETPS